MTTTPARSGAATTGGTLGPRLNFQVLGSTVLLHLAIMQEFGMVFFQPNPLDGFGAVPDTPASATGPPPGVFYPARRATSSEMLYDHSSEPSSTDLEFTSDPPPGLPPPGFNLPEAVAEAALAEVEDDLPPDDFADGVAEVVSPRSDAPFRFVALEDITVEAAAKESMSLTLDAEGRGCWAEWVVRGQRLKSMDKQAVSPVFRIQSASRGPTSFKIMICPAARNDGRGGGSFKQGKGKGRVHLKCTEELEADAQVILKYWVVIGEGAMAQPARGPFAHDFAEHSCSELGGQEAWNFAAAVDPRDTFMVRFLFEEAEPAQGDSAAANAV